MPAPAPDYKKRPPPIAIPQWPPVAHGQNAFPNAPLQGKGSNQHPQRFASSSTQQAARSGTTTPLTSPLELGEFGFAVPKSGSQASKHRASAMTTLSGLMGQARTSPRKPDHGSVPSRHGSTTRSRQSERSHRSAIEAQAQLEIFDQDETTSRSQIESRTENKLFKMTGQIPPTPTTGPIDPEKVFIRTEDLRAQCRAVSGDKHTESGELAKSPKKKLFGVSLPMFSKTAAVATAPAMPQKAAQIFGTKPSRKPRRFEPRPIRSARVVKTPTKISRSDTSKSLSATLYGDITSDGLHRTTSTRGNHTTVRSSPEKENTPLQEQASVQSSFESMPPPTPPAKDTPPEFRLHRGPSSPLRRAPSHEDLRESYGSHPNKGMQVQLPFPMFALSPSPPKTAIHGMGDVSPTKYRPYTAEDYTKLIEGEALHWLHADEGEAGEMKEGGHSAPLADERRDLLLQLPQSSRSDDKHYNERIGRRLSPLPPRFYSPSDRSVQLFTDGESPSQNTDASRMLFAPLKPSLLNEGSNDKSVETMYQNSVNAIESDAAKPQTADKDCAQPPSGGPPRVKDGFAGMHGLPTGGCESNRKSERSGAHTQHAEMSPAPMLRGGNGTAPSGPWPSPRTQKTVEDHFFMTNEHLDVVGKTTYDALDMYTKQQINATNTKHEQLVVILDKHIEDLKSRINLVSEKADDNCNQTHNIGAKLDQFETFLKTEVLGVMTEQTKKTAEVESSLKEIQKAMAHMQQTVEKLSELKPTPHHPGTGTLPTSGTSNVMSHVTNPMVHTTNPMSHDTNPMPHVPAAQQYDSHSDPRGNYGNNWQSQAWNGRSTYQGRHRGEASSYAGVNPYHYSNGSQYNNTYMNGYSADNFSPSSPNQPYTYGQKPAQ
ncbi:hypothetical protein C7974DRAFT_456076 [Boeremia exigua]|uniref:uncharacterized protein n=1 Tax=Boeremia exigua TaxID=749465 RepID=UPI001E8D45A3|nr:uncharacterized protein C7974DRAFT_456076 [Boeremia exigua]KAH6625775.1 hypothetical protein C7974DRAFT_456076 [Boeremia exigua]